MKTRMRLFAACAVLALSSSAAFAASLTKGVGNPAVTHNQTMVYEVYAGGIHAVQAQLNVTFEKGDRYNIKLEAETRGFLNKLVPWQGMFETLGWRRKDAIDQPEIHRSEATWRGDKELKEYSYSKDGKFKGLRIVEEGVDKSPESVDTALTEGTTDILTATLAVMEQLAGDGKCEGKADIFDGDRRFSMAFRQDNTEVLKATDYNVYEGESVRCEVEVTPSGGSWHKKPRGWMSIQEQGRQRGSLPTIWMAKVDANGPAVPVKVRVKTEYGTLFMHLAEYRSGDTIIKANITSQDQ